MRRGRWVAYCIALFLFFFVVYTTYAIPLGVSATVLLSPQWKEALRINSETKIDTSHPHVLSLSQHSLGIEKLPVENQKIQLLVLKNGVLVSEQEKITNRKGAVDFVFVSQQYGAYIIIVINKSDMSPFIVKSTNVSL